ncbi:ChbG/HpnK family deacetylase [Bordetella genomosp. 13]|uniref:ChbG/HpnK family deacetylase n=1 Tax=Bordetella genomosp. 13 TaxID=463040 RepID=UPI0011A4C407|nr:ChbG/HpnK family deacetylase [Bordetella genomosp. 13]
MDDVWLELRETRRIVVCADDFGMNSAVDAGVLRLADLGRLSAVSCLSTGPTFASSAASLRHADVDLGLHLNLTEAMEGSLGMRLPHLIASAFGGLLDAAWVDAAIRCQLDVFEAVMGRAPDYVDGHQHVHQLPGVRGRLLAALRERYGQSRPWLRCTVPGGQRGQRLADAAKAHLIGALGGHALRRAARADGWRCNAGLLGVYGLRGGAQAYSRRLHAWLRAARDGDLLMCHPAAPAALHADALSAQRAAEYDVLSRPALATWLRDNGVRIARYTALRGQAARESGMVHAAS